EKGVAQAGTAIDDQYPSVTGRLETASDEGVVLEAAYRRGRPGKGDASAPGPQPRREDAQGAAVEACLVRVAEIGGGGQLGIRHCRTRPTCRDSGRSA